MFEVNYDGGYCSILRTSEDKVKLEEFRQSLINRFNAEKARVNELNKQRISYINKFRNNLRKYMISNIDAIRDCDINSQKIKPFGPSWHPDYLEKYKMELIDRYINNSTYYMFQETHGLKIWEKVFDCSKLSSPIPFLDPERLKFYNNKFKESEGTLFIEEVEHL